MSKCESSAKLLPDHRGKKLATTASLTLLPLSGVCGDAFVPHWCSSLRMRLRRKILPASNTLHEKESFPIRDNNCHFVHYVGGTDYIRT